MQLGASGLKSGSGVGLGVTPDCPLAPLLGEQVGIGVTVGPVGVGCGVASAVGVGVAVSFGCCAVAGCRLRPPQTIIPISSTMDASATTLPILFVSDIHSSKLCYVEDSIAKRLVV